MSGFIELHRPPRMGETEAQPLWVRADDVRSLERGEDGRYTAVSLPGVFPFYVTESVQKVLADILLCEPLS